MNIAIFDTCPQPMWLLNGCGNDSLKKMFVFGDKYNVIEYGLNYNGSMSITKQKCGNKNPRKYGLIIIVNPVDVIDRGISVADMSDSDSIVVVNTDCKDSIRVLDDINARIVTCGFGAKSSVTASAIEASGSISTGKMLLCVQRSLPTLSGGMLDPQEVSVLLHGGTLYREMAMATAGLILSN